MPQTHIGSRTVSVELDEVLREVGAAGRYQLLTMAMIMLPTMLTAVYNSQYVFAAADVDYRCLVPECEAAAAAAAAAQYAAGEWAAWALVPRERCRRRRPASGACARDAFSASDTVECTAWVYSSKDTIVGYFGLGCQDWKRTLVGTVHSAGLLVALPFTGLFSDAYGRRLAFVATAASRAATGLARAFAPNYLAYVLLEFADSALGSGTYSTGFILALEMVGPKWRVVAGNSMSSSFACGQMLLALAAWAVPRWQSLTLTLYLPSAAVLAYLCCMEESVRWLLHQGRKAEAARIIFKAANMNRRRLSPEVTRQLLRAPAQPPPPPQDALAEAPPSPLRQAARSRVLAARVAICGFWWMTTTFTYYGLSINSVALAGNKYANFALTSLVEIPGYFLSVLTLDRVGRKAAIMTAFFLCGLALLVLPFVPSGARLWLTLAGKLFISMVFSSLYIYTVELYPTGARHALLAASSAVGRLGNLLAPQTPLLLLVWEPLPYLIFGAMCVAAGLLVTLTPETLRMRLPDTVEEAENMALAKRHRHRHPVDILDD